MQRRMVVLLIVLAIPVGANATEPDVVNPPGKGGLLVPAYFYPAAEGLRSWERLMGAAQRVNVIAIANPDNGPGTKRNSDYQRVIRRAAAAEVKVVGYVSTRYGKRDLAEVNRDINHWLTWYPEISGIFLDEQASEVEQLGYYRQLATSIHRRRKESLVIANPGVFCDQKYFAETDIDIFCVYEKGKSLESLVLPDRLGLVPSGRLAGLVHAAPADQLAGNLESVAARQVGWLYVTDDRLPNPWDQLPSYWNDLVKFLAAPSTNR